MLFNLIYTFNNREKAIGIWLFIFFVWALARKEIRESMLSLIKTMFLTKLFFVFLSMFLYVASVLFLLYKIKIWDYLLLKDTIFWIIGTGFVLLLNVNKVTDNARYFKDIFLDALKLTVVLEFIVNLYSFSFWVEVVLMPLLFVVVIMNVFAGIKEEYKLVKKITDWILAIFGIYTFIFLFSQTLSNYQNFTTLYNLRVFILPPILTFSFLPFLYIFVLVMTYETLFLRLDFIIKGSQEFVRYIKREILKLCLLNLGKLNKFIQLNNKNFIYLTNINDVTRIIKQFQGMK